MCASCQTVLYKTTPCKEAIFKIEITGVQSNFLFNLFFVSSDTYPENPKWNQVIVGSMNIGYVCDTARNRTLYLFRPKREPIILGQSDGQLGHSDGEMMQLADEIPSRK